MACVLKKEAVTKTRDVVEREGIVHRALTLLLFLRHAGFVNQRYGQLS